MRTSLPDLHMSCWTTSRRKVGAKWAQIGRDVKQINGDVEAYQQRLASASIGMSFGMMKRTAN